MMLKHSWAIGQEAQGQVEGLKMVIHARKLQLLKTV